MNSQNIDIDLEKLHISKDELKKYVQGRASDAGFLVTVKNSNSRALYLKCVHGGEARNTRNLSEASRTRNRDSMRLQLPLVNKSQVGALWRRLEDLPGQ
jgi:hypothetical protein